MWRKHPMARLLIPYLFGLFLTDTGVMPPDHLFHVFLILLSLFLLVLSWIRGRRFYQRSYGLVLMTWLCLMGCYHYRAATRLPAETHALCAADSAMGTGIVLGREERPGKGPRLVVAVSSVSMGASAFSAFRQKVMVYLSDTSTVVPGDQIHFRGRFTLIPPPQNPCAFDYGRFLKYQGIQLRHFAADVRVMPDHSLRSRALRWIYQLRQQCRTRLLRGISAQSGQGILLALILGDKSDLDQDLRTAFAAAGAMHVLAVSGLHVGIIGLFAGFLFRWLPLGKYRKPVRIVASLLSIWLFTMLTGAGASVQRAAVMFTVVLTGQLTGGRARIWNSLSVAAFLLLWWQPLLLFQLGFQLSFLAVAGIVFFHPILVKCWFPGHPVLKYAWSLFCVGCAAQLTTMPLTIFHFGQFPLLFWLSGWIAIPLATILLGAGLLKVAFASVPRVDALLGDALEGLTYLLNESMTLLSSWSFATLDGLILSPAATWSLYLSLLVVMIAYRWQPGWRGWSGWPLLVACVFTINDHQIRDQQRDWYVLVGNDAPILEIVRGDQALRVRSDRADSMVVAFADRGLHQHLGIRIVRDVPWPEGSTFIIREKGMCLGVVGNDYPTPAAWSTCSNWLIQTRADRPAWLDESTKEGTVLILDPEYSSIRQWEGQEGAGTVWSLSEKGGFRLPKNSEHE